MSDPVARLNTALEGRYAIERELGEGGMATVYLADDLKHQRKVALKVLKPELAAVVGAERFLAEITTTANLTHPHILPLFDSGEADGFLFYVMPYVEGDTLKDRLDREHQLPVTDAVQIATDMAEALDYAHRQGVIHRDIKPANVLMLEGKPVISDFGIALAVGAAGGGRLTETGLSLGTPHYMSPEQAMGDQNVGPQTDTYALGSVLYEMLTGDPPYMGSTAQAVLGQIIAGETASATKKRASVPANVDAALRCALEKLPADRFPSAQDFARALGDEHFRYGELATAGASAAVGPWKRLTILGWSVAALLAVTLGWSLLVPEPPAPLIRYSLALAPGEELAGSIIRPRVALSPDGERLLYIGPGDGGGNRLWVRQRDELGATPLFGSEGAQSPFFSPDGTRFGFINLGANGQQVMVASLSGGAPLVVVDGVVGFDGASWGSDDFIYFDGLTEGGTRGIMRVPAGGGMPEQLTTVDTARGETDHVWPHILPGAEGLIFTVIRSQSLTDADIAGSDVTSGEHRILTRGVAAKYATSGHLLHVSSEGALLAAPFDEPDLELTGESVEMATGLSVRTTGAVDLALSRSGRMAYVTGALSPRYGELRWVDRRGNVEAIDALDPAFTGLFEAPSFSPDGRRVAVQRQLGGADEDIWIYDFDQETFTRLTFEGRNLQPFWNPDGTEVGFSSNREGLFALYARPADLSSETRLLVAAGDAPGLYTAIWTPDWLIYRRGGPLTSEAADLWYVAPDPDSTPVAFLETPYLEYSPSISPDGRWLAYQSNESGRFEVYVRPFPGPAGQSQVSVSGGRNAVWARSGREIYYISSDLSLTVATVRTDPTFAVESREQLTSWPYFLQSTNRDYDLAPDDQRFLAVVSAATEAQEQLILVQNFFEELRRVVAN